jgi:hypothetical protein
MSVWPEVLSNSASLSGSEGALVSVSVTVEPCRLEQLLDALAQLPFPINPQIYHDAAVIRVYADGRQETEPTTIVEFPAYAGWLDEARRVLNVYGFGADSLHVTDMLEDLHSEPRIPAAPGRTLVKHARTAGAAS